MVSIEAAIRYPMNKEDWIKTLAIGGVLVLFSFLIVPAIVVYGYLITAIRDSLEGSAEPPAFEDWGSLLRKGILGWVIGIIYLIVPILIALVTVGGSIAAMATGSRAGQAAGLAGMFGGLGVSAILSLIFGYFAVVGLVNFARTDEFGAAFDFSTIRQVAFDSDYFVPWLLSIGVFIVASILSGILNVVPFLGAIVAAFVFFYADVVAATLWADGFTSAFGNGGREPTSGEEATA